MNGALTLHPKTAATGLGTAGGLVVLWILSLFHVNATIEEAGALVGALAWLGSWLAPIANAERSRLTHQTLTFKTPSTAANDTTTVLNLPCYPPADDASAVTEPSKPPKPKSPTKTTTGASA